MSVYIRINQCFVDYDGQGIFCKFNIPAISDTTQITQSPLKINDVLNESDQNNKHRRQFLYTHLT